MRGYKQDIENELWGMIGAAVLIVTVSFGTMLALITLVRWLIASYVGV